MAKIKEGDYLCFRYGNEIIVDKITKVNCSKVYTETSLEVSYEKALKDKIPLNDAKLLLENRVQKPGQYFGIHKKQLDDLE